MTDHDFPQDTIAAISTPPGRGGIGIVRLSGPQSVTIATQLIEARDDFGTPEDHAHARFVRIRDPRNPEQTIDEALATVFHPPNSYTGELLVELAAHGSPIVLEALLRAALAHGARLANPGEFTQRAFLAGKIDLTQAEAVHDLIAAQTLEQARVAAQQMGGAISRRVAPAKDDLVHIIALLEAGMDFASGELDDVDVVPPETIADFIVRVKTPLEVLAASFARGRLLRDGVTLALVGRPNAGKSSLFNRLLARDRAIVTPLPGTTRDTVEEPMSLHGIPVRLIDTAGLRLETDAADEAERLGMARSREALADAGLVLLVHDATTGLNQEESALLDALSDRPHLLVWNKVDLVDTHDGPTAAVRTSALTGAGLDDVRKAILRAINAEGALADNAALTNLRQQQAIAHALEALDAAGMANTSHLPHEIILMDLHAALKALDGLTGVTTTEDILGRIFATFCIGK